MVPVSLKPQTELNVGPCWTESNLQTASSLPRAWSSPLAKTRKSVGGKSAYVMPEAGGWQDPESGGTSLHRNADS